jgi:hypothetical protein
VKGNKIENPSARPKKQRTAIQSALAKPLGAADSNNAAPLSFPNAVPTLHYKTKDRVVATLPWLLIEVSDASPTLLDDQSFLLPVLVNSQIILFQDTILF